MVNTDKIFPEIFSCFNANDWVNKNLRIKFFNKLYQNDYVENIFLSIIKQTKKLIGSL